MYEAFYGLRERPFELTPDPRFLCLTDRHHEALCSLQYGISGRKGLVVLTGDAGTGKTIVVYAALQNTHDVLAVYLSNPALTRAEFFEALANGFGLGPHAAASKSQFLHQLGALLAERQAHDLATVLVIDEAQSLPDDLFEEVRLLANFETATDRLLTIVLVGQPELAERLDRPSSRALKQRIAMRARLAPLNPPETPKYLARRIERAGGRLGAVFTDEAVAAIHDRAHGIPRVVNIIGDGALVGGFAADERPVGGETVYDVCRDLELDVGVEREEGRGDGRLIEMPQRLLASPVLHLPGEEEGALADDLEATAPESESESSPGGRASLTTRIRKLSWSRSRSVRGDSRGTGIGAGSGH